MRHRAPVLAAVLALVLYPAAAWPQSSASSPMPGSAGTPSAQAVKAAADATKAAKRIDFDDMTLAGAHGSILLYPIGRTRTRIVITVPQGSQYNYTMYPGSECSNNRMMAAAAVRLKPTNMAAVGGSQSDTIVALPIEKVTSNYVVDVRNATTKAQAVAACAKLGP
jgi:ApbE superfamily uncharacterized protein (UPF0280 family)